MGRPWHSKTLLEEEKKKKANRLIKQEETGMKIKATHLYPAPFSQYLLLEN